jgi:hypothetical protein
MAPFSQAIESSFSRREDDGSSVYSGVVDPEWLILACVFLWTCR